MGKAAMWQYRFAKTTYGRKAETAQSLLDRYASEGWRLAHYAVGLSDGGSFGTTEQHFIFEREVKD